MFGRCSFVQSEFLFSASTKQAAEIFSLAQQPAVRATAPLRALRVWLVQLLAGRWPFSPTMTSVDRHLRFSLAVAISPFERQRCVEMPVFQARPPVACSHFSQVMASSFGRPNFLPARPMVSPARQPAEPGPVPSPQVALSRFAYWRNLSWARAIYWSRCLLTWCRPTRSVPVYAPAAAWRRLFLFLATSLSRIAQPQVRRLRWNFSPVEPVLFPSRFARSAMAASPRGPSPVVLWEKFR